MTSLEDMGVDFSFDESLNLDRGLNPTLQRTCAHCLLFQNSAFCDNRTSISPGCDEKHLTLRIACVPLRTSD